MFSPRTLLVTPSSNAHSGAGYWTIIISLLQTFVEQENILLGTLSFGFYTDNLLNMRGLESYARRSGRKRKGEFLYVNGQASVIS